jgi:hypothetical protein
MLTHSVIAVQAALALALAAVPETAADSWKTRVPDSPAVKPGPRKKAKKAKKAAEIEFGLEQLDSPPTAVETLGVKTTAAL